MSSRKGKVAGDREEKVAWRQRVQQRREMGEKTEKKQRGESFICSEKGEKNRGGICNVIWS